MKRLLYLLLTVVLIAVCLFSCSLLHKPTGQLTDEEEPVSQNEEETTQEDQIAEIEQLEERCRTACNEVDVEGILDCIHPTAAKPMRAMLGIAGKLSGDGEDQVLDLLCQMLGAESSDHTQFCKTLDTDLSDIRVDGDQATASLHYTFEQDGQLYQANADVSFKREDGQWYISKLQGK